MSDEEEEYQVGGIFARCRVSDTWYWWVLWDEPFSQRYREDHWQPAASFVNEDGTATALWLAFENIYPRAWGNVCLIPRLRARLDFPFEFYAHTPEDVPWSLRVTDYRRESQ